jgi:hypothetical protein
MGFTQAIAAIPIVLNHRSPNIPQNCADRNCHNSVRSLKTADYPEVRLKLLAITSNRVPWKRAYDFDRAPLRLGTD